MMKQTRISRRRRRGFSLVEMLLAIGILGIGIIAIASMFPVGLTQQRHSADAIIGPTVAGNAYAILRSRISPDDFGWFDANGNIWVSGGPAIGFDSAIPTIPGDFTWRRPAFYMSNRSVTDQLNNSRGVTLGSVNIFRGADSGGGNAADTNYELPFNTNKWRDQNNNPFIPDIVITQEERLFPQDPMNPDNNIDSRDGGAQYAWDFAFRRFQGRMQVAIFVYRVQAPGGESGPYAVAPGTAASDISPLPWRRVLDGTGPQPNDPWGYPESGMTPGDARDNYIPGTESGELLDFAGDYDFGWQAPSQWLLDQNNNIMRVLSGRRTSRDGPVELTRPVQAMPYLAPYHFAGGQGGIYNQGDADFPVTAIWYIPPVDTNGWRLTPVYVIVRDFE